ncbi:MAG: class I mannose-6-phosphate isomerase, partial [Clostridium sp.]|uniref:type I phosphomannose isomerase catalytic subunit n=1 Tax=Clostridium sp. DSM 8431 TaxID=1761781 RepID=UPI0008E4068E|nr:type I phosphomannose isomerase catalytic subunit [Clostridium sp. DSM 8431]MCR4943376.1 class I mannose-6-phosphate isomerase [Clostridium sp.]SFU62920.1 mannose-6-phosphate isomerase, type 1 [Clostridium sp. DSM 8431]
MYPIKFKNLYYEKIWGGRDLEGFRDNLPEGNIGESWDVACHDNGMSVVVNGEFKGETLEKIIEKHKEKIVGNKLIGKRFPLLVKLINSKDKLSVQVHPDNEYAEKVENSLGKTEAWYVVDAKEGASLIVGTKDCDKEKFKKAIENGETEKYLNKIPVKKGDCFLINSGLVHAICEGIIIAEIQQNSDITYRIYDYNRGRELHVDKALDVINFDLKVENESDKTLEKCSGYAKGTLCNGDFFTIEKYVIEDEIESKSNEDEFFILTCTEGEGVIETDNGEKTSLLKGESILIPAYLGHYLVKGNLTVLKTFI